MKSIESRVSTVEANLKNLSDSMNRIEGWLGKSYEERNKQHVETIQRLTVIETMQVDFKRYQVDCDDERKEIKTEQAECKNYRSKQAGIAIASSALISGFISILGFWFGSHK